MGKRSAKQKPAEGISFYRTKEFKKLHEKWYKKLEKSGFKDIEDIVMPQRPDAYEPIESLKTHDNYHFLPLRPDEFEERQDYFLSAEQFLEAHKFKSRRDEIVWELHSKGYGLKEITMRLKANTRLKGGKSRQSVYMTLAKYKLLWREWYRTKDND